MRVVLTPNLAIDRLLEAEAPFEPGAPNRVQLAHERAGGKGVNLARSYRALGGGIVVAGFVAGDTGRRLARLLDAEGFDTHHLMEVAGETRSCHIVVHAGGHPTEILERGPDVTPDDWHTLVRSLPIAPVVVSGSLPPGLPASGFAGLLKAFRTPPAVDTSGAALTAAVDARVELVKPNRSEAAELWGTTGDTLASAIAHHARHGVPLLVTLGESGALWVADRVLRVRPPRVRAVNPVASGDAFLGGFLWARDEGWDVADALRLAAACGADNARNGGGGSVTAAGAFELMAGASVEELG